jgi:hypothetical protein
MAALAIACTASLAAAQTTAPADTPADGAKTAPTMTTTETESTQKPPLPGANSFTEGQARERITKAGFEDVQQLKKDDQGVWRGSAKKSGQQVGVALDYRGNIVQQ